jgi:hypothetical protein
MGLTSSLRESRTKAYTDLILFVEGKTFSSSVPSVNLMRILVYYLELKWGVKNGLHALPLATDPVLPLLQLHVVHAGGEVHGSELECELPTVLVQHVDLLSSV